jgi:hypothetical protein
VIINRVWNGQLDLLTTRKYRQFSATSDLHTLQFTTAPAKPFPVCCVLISCLLATASNCGDSLDSRAHVVPCRTVCQLSPLELWTQFSAATANYLVANSSRLFCKLPTPKTHSLIFNYRFSTKLGSRLTAISRQPLVFSSQAINNVAPRLVELIYNKASTFGLAFSNVNN